MAAAAASRSFVTVACLGRIQAPLEEDDMDVDVVLEQKGKRKQRETKRKQVDEEEEDERLLRPKKRTNEVVEIVEDSLPRTKKRKEWIVFEGPVVWTEKRPKTGLNQTD